jgi:hypothetical protein
MPSISKQSPLASCCSLAPESRQVVRLLVLGGLFLALPLLGYAEGGMPDEAAAMSAGTSDSQWLSYTALGLSVLNLVLIYFMYTSSSRADNASSLDREMTGSSARTEKRMEKRKREIDDLRLQVDELQARLEAETAKRLTTVQTQEFVRALINDELGRGASTRPTPNR